MRQLTLVAALLLPTALSAQKHPDFNDQGALSWQTKLSSAKTLAAETGKFIFVEYGREA